jgi:hypothetical protein
MKKKRVPHAVVISYKPNLGLTGRAWGGTPVEPDEIVVVIQQDRYHGGFIGWYRLKKAWVLHKMWQVKQFVFLYIGRLKGK